MIHRLRITTLVENTVRSSELLGEHGLSFWVEADGRRVLFDTGQGKTLAANAAALGVDLGTAGTIVLSHGHFDHTGGLPAALEAARQAKVYLHPDALEAKFARPKDGKSRDIGIPASARAPLDQCADRVLRGRGPTALGNGIHLTGEIPRRTAFEDVGGPFFLDEAGRRPDPLIDDQALWIEMPAGIVVLLGCAHSGVINTLDAVAEQSGGRPTLAVLGGMHLVSADAERLQHTVEGLDRHNPQMLAPAHCTGARGTALLSHRFGDAFQDCCAGSRFELG